MKENSITRRGFVASAAAMAVAAAAGAHLGALPQEAWCEPASAAGKLDAKDGEYHGYCAMCMERGSCGNITTVKDGVVVSIEGDPARPSNKGTLCPRGKGAIMNMYNPYRIKAPMKRTNPEKGMDVDPGWVEITWDEAIGIAAEKLREVYDRDPRELVHFYGFSAYESSHATFGHGEWCLEFGSPNESSGKGQMCSVHYGACYTMRAFPTVNYDSQYTKYVVALGKGMGGDLGSANGDGRASARALKGGMKVVTVAPYCGMDASAGEWVPIIPGADLSFIYGLMHTMLFELDSFDKDFVSNRTNAPYLIDEDNGGDYLRNKDGKPLLVDADGTLKAFDDPTLANPQLEGEFSYEGKTYPTGFMLFKDALADFNADWASEQNGIPAERIRGIAQELCDNACFGQTIVIDGEEIPYRPSCLFIGRGVTNHTDGTLIDMNARLINILLGNVGYPGGVQGSNAPTYKPDADGVMEPFNEAAFPKSFSYPPTNMELKEFMPHRHSINSMMMRVMCDPEHYGFDYKPSLIFSSGCNPIISNTEPSIAIEAISKVPYVIYHACYHMDEMALMSDLLLPESAALEVTTVYKFPGIETSGTIKDDKDFLMNAPGIVMKHGVGELYNTREGNEILLDIFERADLIHVLNNVANKGGCIGVPKGMGMAKTPYELDPNTRYDMMDMWDRCMKAKTGGIGLEYFDDPSHAIYPILPYKNEAAYYSSNRDKKTRFSLYLMQQKKVGDWLIPKIKATGRDPFEFVGVDIDELRRRYTALPYYPSDDLRPTFNAPAEYDLRATTFKKPFFLFRMGSMDQNPITRDFSKKFDPEFNAVLMNSATARAKGLSHGEQVVVESQFGKTKGVLYVTERVEPSTVCIGGTTGRRSPQLGDDLMEDTFFNELLCGNVGYIDPIDGAFDSTARVKVYKG
nr:molybdopterin-dependent oxidoreductase [Adlercreutzia sp. ZJ473]